jgi:hypothetical protein
MTFMFEPRVPEIVDRTMRREQPGLWSDVPPRAKEALYGRVQQQLPDIMRQITEEIGLYIDQLLDPKILVIDHFQRSPALANKVLKDVGSRELRLMVNFGFLFGFLLGIPVAVITHFVTYWWLLPLLGIIVGLGHERARNMGDLRAGRGDQAWPVQAARPVPAPPERSRRGVCVDHRRSRGDDGEHRGLPAERTAL